MEGFVTSDILRLRDAVTRDTADERVKDRIQREAGKIRTALTELGEYRLDTQRGTIVIRSRNKTA
jgi:hypothetical protein